MKPREEEEGVGDEDEVTNEANEMNEATKPIASHSSVLTYLQDSIRSRSCSCAKQTNAYQTSNEVNEANELNR